MLCPSQKYPRTYHLPNSPGGTSDDKRMTDVSGLLGVPLLVSEKLDGANVVLTTNCIYARSHAGPPVHISYDWLKSAHGLLQHLIPLNYSIFCEYTYAVHSIVYDALPSYIWVIGVRDDETGLWMSWPDTEMVAGELGLPTVPVIWKGSVQDEMELEDLTTRLGNEPGLFGPREGVVVRVEREFDEGEFNTVISKWVRKGHVPANAVHWAKRPVQKQRLLKPVMSE